MGIMQDANTLAFNDGALQIEVRPETSSEQMVENMRSSLSRNLPQLRRLKAHDNVLSIASGGPSLEDTYRDLEGHVAAVNGSLRFLLARNYVPHFCGVLDSHERMADIVEADKRVNYLIASNCHPALFDKLINKGCKVFLWHSTPDSIGTHEGDDLIKAAHPDSWLQIGGGCTIGLRLINIGYVLGYRKFHLHGLDSSFRDRKTHAYEDRRDGDWVDHSSLEINGHRTSLNFLAQVTSFANLLANFQSGAYDPVEFSMFGDGLLQEGYRFYLKNKATMSPQDAFQQW